MSQDNDADTQAVLDRLHRSLLSTIKTLDEVELLASDLPAEAPSNLFTSKISQLVDDYRSLEDASGLESFQKEQQRRQFQPGQEVHAAPEQSQPGSVSVPQDVLEYVEAGRNPHVYTRQFSEAVVRDNQAVHGKMKAHADFANDLELEILAHMPELRPDLEQVAATKESL